MWNLIYRYLGPVMFILVLLLGIAVSVVTLIVTEPSTKDVEVSLGPHLFKIAEVKGFAAPPSARWERASKTVGNGDSYRIFMLPGENLSGGGQAYLNLQVVKKIFSPR